MSKYLYKAKDGPGKTVEGELSAQSRQAALARIDAMGYSPIWVLEKDSVGDGEQLFRSRWISRRDVTVFTRQLGGLLKSGVPILKALSTVGEQTENRQFRKIVAEIEGTTRNGNMLSDAISTYPGLFPDLYVNMVRSGESAGMLDTILFRLAESREKEEETRRKVQTATAYPILIVIVGIVTVFVLLAFFLPRVIGIFEHYRHGRLPLPTRILMATSDFFSANWYWMILGAVLLWAVGKRVASNEKGKSLVDRVKLSIPFVGNFIRQTEIARFARTLSLLIVSGIPIDRSLTLSAAVVRNAVLKAEIEKVRTGTIQQGVPLSVGLKKAACFPPFLANMIAVGEESGRLEESLDEVASFYEKEVEQQSRLITSLLEPILILIVGAIVALIVSAMLLPIFELSTSF
jgi:type II secretory pathway component PulF